MHAAIGAVAKFNAVSFRRAAIPSRREEMQWHVTCEVVSKMKTLSTLACAALAALALASCKRSPEEKKATQPTPEMSQEFGTSVKGSIATGDTDPGQPGSGKKAPEETDQSGAGSHTDTGGPASGNAEAGHPGREKGDARGTGSQALPHELPGK